MASIIDYRGVEIHRAEKQVLKDVSFSMGEGEFCYLVGRVGSGKSSLLKSMYAEVPVYSGEKAEVLEYDMLGLKRKQIPYLRRNIGIVFQDFQLLQDRSVYDNLSFVLRATGWRNRSEMDQRIEDVLIDVGMQNKSYKMPHEPGETPPRFSGLARRPNRWKTVPDSAGETVTSFCTTGCPMPSPPISASRNAPC